MGISMEAQKEAILEKSKKTMSVPEMRRLLGLKKTDSYWLVHRNFFQTYIVNGQMRVDIASFEKWYANQVKHKKVNGAEPGAELMKSSYSFRDAANLLGIHSSNLYEIWRDQNLKTIVNTPFSEQLPLAQLHWIIADENESITVESMSDGLHIYDNPVGVLTNNPPFPQQMFQLNNYMYLSPKQPKNTFGGNLALDAYSRGMGSLGLPGDLSSSSRFVRVAFTKVNAISGESEEESVSQFFHILGSVDQQRGCCEVTDGKYEITLYTSCCNVIKGIYYYNTYENHQISAVDMHAEDLESNKLICYPVIQGERINYQNK